MLKKLFIRASLEAEELPSDSVRRRAPDEAGLFLEETIVFATHAVEVA